MFKPLLLAGILSLSLIATQSMASGRDYISIVGSSTVYPFATVVAERFGKTTKYRTPKIEATGSGGGFKLFCGGIGVNYPDIVNASRKIKASELERCEENRVGDIVEVKIGYDGIVFANSKAAPFLKLESREIFLALAQRVPDKNNKGQLIANPYSTWKDIDSRLPDVKIEVIGPPPTSGTRDAFVELIMERGAQSFGFIKELASADPQLYRSISHTIREDGAYIEAGENDNLIVQKLRANPSAVGIFGFSFLDQNTDTIQGAAIDGYSPHFEDIANGNYPLARPLFFYFKKEHVDVIPGMKGYLREFSLERSWGDEGYLVDKGMVPLPEKERAFYKENILENRPVQSR